MPTIIDEVSDLQTVDMPTVDISKYVITDISLKSINSNVVDIISDYLTLEFTVSNFAHKWQDETTGVITNTSSSDDTIKYQVNIWKTLLHRLYHNITLEHLTERQIISKDSQYYLQLWVGNSRVICHFDKMITDGTSITLNRFYNMKNFLYNSGSTTVPDTFITTRLSALPLNMGKSNMYITYDNRAITYCNYNLNDNYAGVIPSDLTYYVFDLDTTKNDTTFDAMVADDNFYKMSISSEEVKTWSEEKGAYITYNVSSLYVYMKTPFSEDTNVALKYYTADRIYRDTKTDIYDHETTRLTTVGTNIDGEYVLSPTTPLDNNDILIDKGYTVDFEFIILNDIAVSNFLAIFFGKAVQLKNKVYLYLNEIPSLDRDIIWNGKVEQFAGDDIEDHVDPVVRNFRIDSTTTYVFDPIRIRYTYTFAIDTEVDDTSSATFNSNNAYVKNNIVGVSINGGNAIIEAKIQLGGTTSIPTSIIQVTGTHSYSTITPLFESVDQSITISATTDTFNVVDGQYVAEYEIFTDLIEKYDTVNKTLTTVSTSVNPIPNSSTMDLVRTNLTYSNLRFEKGIFKVDINNYSYFLQNCKLSTLRLNIGYTWRETIITENYPFTKTEPISIYIDSDNAKQYSTGLHPDEYYMQNSTINGTKYYIYKCTLGYEYADLEISAPDETTINYVGLNGDDIAYIKSTVVDPTYATIPTGKVGFSIGYTTYGIPRYTNLDLKLYDMSSLSKSKEVYETYQFTGTAYDKFLKILRVANIEAEGMPNASTVDYTV